MFNLANYEDVDTRIHKFYETYPDGSILTELITNEEKEGIANPAINIALANAGLPCKLPFRLAGMPSIPMMSNLFVICA